ncbi:calcium:proton antiporter [Synechococcus sp. CC9605]|uniref:calcium:proton antiporter n=1 Tax=Synechococcus sp. (strain CC9605) TaxID=110662 RepID=UPI00005D5D99|nr:sodium:calcium antiporter [Synechococcus sp. CC9605]ABB35914.1 putative CaCA family calcium/proton exchanger [Synechococcus sp. CC9605]
MVRLLLPILIGLVALVSIEFSGVMAWLLVQPTSIVLAGLALLSGVVLVLSKSVANQADRVSELIGQPYGALVLTAAVMTIELALVASTMLTGESNPTLARDSMFSVVMIALTGVTGICNVLAAVRRGTLGSDGQVDTSQMAAPNLLGALTYWDLISTMCVLALVIPNFSRSTTEANFSTPVNAVLSVVAFGVYAIFLTAQMGRYRSLYTERESLIVAVGGGGEALETLEAENNDNDLPLWKAASLLVAGLLVVCLIAESMGQLIETGITDLGLPSSLAGVLVAMLILAPEALNAIQAASAGEVQRSINTLYGSVVATVSLTVPAVLVLGGITGTDVILGLEPFEMVLLALTLILSYPHARLTGIEGLMKLVIFLFWILLQVA